MSFDMGRFENMFMDAETSNKGLFAEQRSNIQLYAGDHYARITEKIRTNERDGKISEEARIRLTENHIQVICKRYINALHNTVGGVGMEPYNKYEPSDKKNAEVFFSIWSDISDRHQLDSGQLLELFYFIVCGEVWRIRTWDAGKNFDYYDETVDEFGNSTQTPRFKGDLNIETPPPYDMLTSPAKVPWDRCPHVFRRKLVQTGNLKASFKDKAMLIEESSGMKEFRIWNSITHDYEAARKDMSLVRELYIRPNEEFPQGYFVIATENIKLAEGTLPFGIFPVDKCGYDDIEQSPRSRSLIKQLRPVQAEINRMVSKITEHQITLGDDKLVTYDGATISSSVKLPGIRHIKVNGQVQNIVAGRTGDQYLEHYRGKVAVLYQLAMMDIIDESKAQNQDPFAMLWRSMKQKSQFNIYQEKFHEFKRRDTRGLLELAQRYYDDNRFVVVAGKSEAVNIAEFKSKEPTSCKFKIVERSKDLDTMFAKQLAIQHMIQYLGPNMPKEVMSRIMAGMPFLSDENIAQDVTVDSRSVENDILALDRGEQPPAYFYDNHDMYLSRLTARMKEPDFEYIKQKVPNVTENYEARNKQHAEFKAEQQRQIAAAQQGFIPMGGGLVAVNISTLDPKTNKPHRIYLPSAAIEWVAKQLETQGMAMSQQGQLPPSAQAQVSSLVGQASNLTQSIEDRPQGQPGPSGGGITPQQQAAIKNPAILSLIRAKMAEGQRG